MTIKIIDGFDVYPDVFATAYGLQGAWVCTGTLSVAAPGRFGGQCLNSFYSSGQSTNFAGQPLATPGNTFAIGFACNLSHSLPSTKAILHLLATNVGGTLICGIGINASQQPYLFVGAETNQTAVSPNIITPGAWHYYELIATLGGSGALALWIDGIEVASFSGSIPNGPAAFVALGSPVGHGDGAGINYAFDDFYLSDTATRVGEMRVETLYPASNAQSQWTPLSGGSNFAMVDEPQVDGDASYVFSSTVGQQDLYGITSLTGTPLSIPAVQVRVCAEKDDAATRQLASALKSGATLVAGATFAVPLNSYVYQRDVFTTDPHTSAGWTSAAVNALEIGQTVIA